MEIDKETLYSKAQDSAEHHNRIMWHLIYIGFGLSLWINYTVMTIMAKGIINTASNLILLFFGSLTFFYFNKVIEISNKRRTDKIKFCAKYENNKFKKPSLPFNKIKSIWILRTITCIIILVYLAQTILLILQNKNIVWYHIVLGVIIGIVIIFSLSQEILFFINDSKNPPTRRS